jgi:hypothetical protein
MKKRYPIGIAVFLLAMGLVLLGCPTDNGGGGIKNPENPPNNVASAGEAEDYFNEVWGTLSEDQKAAFINLINESLPAGRGPIEKLDDLEDSDWEGIKEGWSEIKDTLQEFVDEVKEQNDTTPSGGGGPGITFTGIDSRYNGQYASFRSSGGTPPAGGVYLIGSATASAITGVQISGGSVTIPVYLVQESSQTGTSYNGSDKDIKIYLNIKSSASFAFEDLFSGDYEEYTINSVNFTNGSASVNVGGGGNTGKTLVITNISATQAAQGQSGFMVGIFQAGTTPQDALQQKGVVTGADSSDVTLSPSAPHTATVSLSDLPNGTYDIYLVLGSGSSASYYQKQNVPFTSASTSVSAVTFSPLQLQ